MIRCQHRREHRQHDRRERDGDARAADGGGQHAGKGATIDGPHDHAVDRHHDKQQWHPGEQEAVQVVQHESRHGGCRMAHPESGERIRHGGHDEAEVLRDLGIVHVDHRHDVHREYGSNHKKRKHAPDRKSVV